MDPDTINSLAQAAVNALHPYWPALAAGAAKKLGESIPSAIRSLWDKIWGRCSEKPVAKESLDDLLAAHDDADLEAAFRVQLRKLLAAEPAFADEVGRLVHSTGTAIQYHSQTHGNDNITVQVKNISLNIGEVKKSSLVRGSPRRLSPPSLLRGGRTLPRRHRPQSRERARDAAEARGGLHRPHDPDSRRA